MNYYLIAHTSYFEKYLAIYEKIINTLKKESNWKIVDNWIDREIKSRDNNIDITEIKKKYSKDLYKNTTKKIKQSDIVIAEISEKSTTVSQQIIYALENNIPVWCFCDENKKENISAFLSSRNDNKLTISIYKPEKLNELIKTNLHKFNKRDIKFNFYLSQEMYDFLEKLSIQKKSTKSKVIREMILSEIKKLPKNNHHISN